MTGQAATGRNRHGPFYAAVAAAALAALPAALATSPLPVMIVASNAFFATYIALSFVRLSRLPAAALRFDAARSDIPVQVIFLITLGAVSAAVAALFVMLNADHRPAGWALALAALAVPLGWMTIHMMAAFHYAHLYWEASHDGKPGRGLEFPGTPSPGGTEFLYFSFVIGMTAQTSDVAITSSAIRRMNVAHAIVSFFFNTVLVAAAVNAAVTLGN